MALAQVKPVLMGCAVSTTAAQASATITYQVNFQPNIVQGLSTTVNANVQGVLAQAMQEVPQIGTTIQPSLLNGAAIGSSNALRRDVHDMRVAQINLRPTDSGQVYFIDVVCQSRAKPTIEFSSSSIQSRTTTYLSAEDRDERPTPRLVRKQMTLDWQIRAGDYGIIGGVKYPPTDNLFPQVPVTGTALRFGSSYRLSATYYSDEINAALPAQLSAYYTATTNKNAIFYPGDEGFWLCSQANAVSHDGGYSYRFAAEYQFNPDGWDTAAVYTDPFTGQLAILTPEAIQILTTPIVTSASVGPAKTLAGSGAGRFPQCRNINQTGLINFMLQPIGVNLSQAMGLYLQAALNAVPQQLFVSGR